MNNKEPTEFMTIGSINLGEFDIQENTMGIAHFGSGLGDYKIQVFNNEGPIPHFHITNEAKNFRSCICIYEPLYFNHGSKISRLDSAQRKILDSWLRKSTVSIAAKGKLTNWEAISFAWDMLENSMVNAPKNQVQPDYTRLENVRG